MRGWTTRWRSAPTDDPPRAASTARRLLVAAIVVVGASAGWLLWPFAPLTAHDPAGSASASAVVPAPMSAASVSAMPPRTFATPDPAVAASPAVATDPFVGVDESGPQSEMRGLDEQIAKKKKEVDLAKLETELTSLRSSGKGAPAARGTGLPGEPLRFPPGFDTSAAPPMPRPAPPLPAAVPLPGLPSRDESENIEWPTVKLVASGEQALAVIELHGRLQHVAVGDTAGAFEIVQITERGVRFRHNASRVLSTIGVAQSTAGDRSPTPTGPPRGTR